MAHKLFLGDKADPSKFSVASIDQDVPEGISREMKLAINQLMEHFETYFQISFMQGSFYFKFDADGQLHLVYAAGIRAHSIGG